MAAMLLQKYPQGKLPPCAYLSKKLTDTEKRWAIWKKEAYAVLWASSPGGISWKEVKCPSRSGPITKTLKF